MEVFMYRFHPRWRRIRDVVAGGGIGELRSVHSVFSYHNVDLLNIRNQADIGGGGLMDIGCYCISLSRLLFGSEPARVCGTAEYDPGFGTDRLASGILEFGAGTATFSCATQMVPYQRATLFGTTGCIEVETPFTPAPDEPARFWHRHPGGVEEHWTEAADKYTLQSDLFSRAVLEGTEVPTPLEEHGGQHAGD
ncbi:MAG TPA: Gfo/Idh/MocA family oxidoreductase [Longimicrobiaceae bacterium]|nr:Gfo/Idh/MocA family oxidoreductase [Longimicrobiaceae bacterium]